MIPRQRQVYLIVAFEVYQQKGAKRSAFRLMPQLSCGGAPDEFKSHVVNRVQRRAGGLVQLGAVGTDLDPAVVRQRPVRPGTAGGSGRARPVGAAGCRRHRFR